MRETFGRYVDPRVVEGLIDRQSLTATDGQRRVMTVLFCDMKGFTGLSEGMTPQGLVKVMNHYLSTMSEPIRGHQGIIDKYIGDAIMAYWGPPFTEEASKRASPASPPSRWTDRGGGVAHRIARAARRAHGPDRLRRAHRHRHRRGPRRQHRLGIHDELHGHGRYGEPRLAAGVRQQVLRQPFAGFGGDDHGGRRCGRSRAKSIAWSSSARPIREAVFEIMGRAGELSESKSNCARTIPRGSPPIGRATGMSATRPSRRRSRPSPATDLRWRCSARRELSAQSAARRLGWLVASRSEVAAGRA